MRPPAPANVLVCGALGAGKTTLLRALLAEIGPSEIVCTLEQTFELFLDQSHPLTFAVETREANSDGSGEITMEELAKRSLRSGALTGWWWASCGDLRRPRSSPRAAPDQTGQWPPSTRRRRVRRWRGWCATAWPRSAPACSPRWSRRPPRSSIWWCTCAVIPRTGFRGVNSIAEVLSSEGDRFEMHEIFGRPRRGDPLTLMGRPRNPEVIERVVEGGLDPSDWPEGD